MTLPAVDTWAIRGLKGPDYKVGPRCSNPGCSKIAEHAHHIVRRSQLAGDWPWIEIDGWIVANLTGLCPGCHDDITGRVGGHKAAIRIDLAKKIFYWCRVDARRSGAIEYRPTAPLDPQPPTPDELAERASETTESEACPFCGHAQRRRRSSTPGLRRRRKSWTVLVPDEVVEDGADVLDAMIENLAPLLPHADASTTGRYYVLVPVLAYASMNTKNLVETLKGVGG